MVVPGEPVKSVIKQAFDNGGEAVDGPVGELPRVGAVGLDGLEAVVHWIQNAHHVAVFFRGMNWAPIVCHRMHATPPTTTTSYHAARTITPASGDVPVSSTCSPTCRVEKHRVNRNFHKTSVGAFVPLLQVCQRDWTSTARGASRNGCGERVQRMRARDR